MKKQLLVAGGLAMACLHGIGQIDPVFQNLNFSSCSSGYFWSQTNYEGLPPNGTSYAGLDFTEASSVLYNFRLADITPQSTLVPDYGALRSELNTIRREEGVIPIVIAEMEYQRLSEVAFDHGWLFATPEGIFQQPQSGNIFATERTLTLLVDLPAYSRGPVRFRLLPSHYLTNVGSLPGTIRLDFDDGLGWRTVLPGQTIQVNYTGHSGEKHIRLEVVRGNQVLKSGMKSNPVPCVSEYDDPNPVVPWTTTGNPTMPWEISTVVDGVTVKGNAYYLPSGPLDKPFIFVEGIDFAFDSGPQRNGDFGWCEFTSGMDVPGYAYNMLKRMPELLDAIRAKGYDIILLDFHDGATWIQHNSALLRHLIQMVNSVKTGTHQNVVAGASMGGQITRHALTKMEQAGEDHCTRLWISLDSPHTGAYVPLSLQQALFALSKAFYSASDFIENLLNRPAAQQMLNVQILPQNGAPIFYPPSRNQWYAEIDALGYPVNCRRVAIANGNHVGVQLPPGAIFPLLNYSCEEHPTSIGPEFELVLMPSCGLPIPSGGPGSSATQLLTTRVTYLRNRNLNDLGGQIASLLHIGIGKSSYSFYTSPNTPMLDFLPGGTRESITTFVKSMNSGLAFSSCPQILSSQFLARHSFISTASALGLSGNFTNQDLGQLVSSGIISCPFDKYYAPDQGNEAHSEISERGLAEALQEILGWENSSGNPLLPPVFQLSSSPNGVFNFGLPHFNQLTSTHVTGGARIRINDALPTHFGGPGHELPQSNFFSVRTLNGCNASLIRLSNVGILSIGNSDFDRYGELIIGKQAILQLDAGGLCEVSAGSRIVVESGGTIRLNSGCLLRNYGEIILKPGSKLVYAGGIFELNGANSRLVLDGGQLHVLPGVQLSFSFIASPGVVEVRGTEGHDFFCGSNSSIRIVGNSPGTPILRVADWSNLWNGNFGQGHLYLENGTVDMSNNGQIWLDMRISATNVRFIDLAALNGFATIQNWYSVGTFTNCHFEGVQLIGQDSRINAEQCRFEGQKSGVRLQGGMYRIIQSQFAGCGIASSALQNPSLADQCTFQPVSGYNNDQMAISDQSLTTLTISASTITGANRGILKDGGSLVLSCNQFAGNSTGVFAINGCRVAMDANSNAGYNRFQNNATHIELKNAGGLNLHTGYNHFGLAGPKMIKGSIAGIACPDNCSAPVLFSPKNTWGANGSAGSPNPSWFEITSGSFSLPCSTPPANLYFCPITISDPTPHALATCKQFVNPITVTKPQKSATYNGAISAQKQGRSGPAGSLRSGGEEDGSNPLIDTPSFDGVALEDALITAASQLEAYDSTASNMTALHLFHEILTSGLDRTHPEVRWKMIWGRDQMKSAFERLVLDGWIEPEANAQAFTPPVQKFVDVLNLMTDSVLTDSTYRSQFYLELDKGQLFRTLGRSDVARQVFIHLGDCQLDSLEQVTLNAWRALCDLDLMVRDQYVGQGLAPEDIIGETDQSDFVLPVSHISDTYYFGLHIHGPEDLEFVSCTSEWTFKSGRAKEKPAFTLQPNPASHVVTIRTSGMDSDGIMEMLDGSGRICLTLRIPDIHADLLPVQLPPDLASGIYLVRLRTATWQDSQLLVIE